MKFFDQLQESTREDREALYAVPVIREALAGQVGLEGYVAFLTQAYYHVRHTVPLMMACGARLPSSLEWLRKAVCEYIDEEYGHEQWILNDIAACGGDAEAVRLGQPSQAIELMVSYLTSHGALDIGHMQHYRELMNRLERDEDKAAVIHVSKVVYRLYADMFRGLPRTVQNEVQHALA